MLALTKPLIVFQSRLVLPLSDVPEDIVPLALGLICLSSLLAILINGEEFGQPDAVSCGWEESWDGWDAFAPPSQRAASGPESIGSAVSSRDMNG
jgi:hypothetical protein